MWKGRDALINYKYYCDNSSGIIKFQELKLLEIKLNRVVICQNTNAKQVTGLQFQCSDSCSQEVTFLVHASIHSNKNVFAARK